MEQNHHLQGDSERVPPFPEDALKAENRQLLDELERAYQNMEMILQQASIEKEIAYEELQRKFSVLERLYSELSSKENTLIHMEKLSSMGQFITEIIHELNNPLAAISGHAQLLLLMEHEPKVTKYINTILKNTERMANYLTRFRKMAYKGKEDFHHFDLVTHLEEAIETIDVLRPKTVSLSLDTPARKLMHNGDPYQITQIYLNLSKNAFDAIGSNGGDKLHFTVSSHTSDELKTGDHLSNNYCQSEKKWREALELANSFALIEVADNAGGMPSAILETLFESFVTTKERGQGSGLGLYISADIAKRHSGNLAVKSQFGKGTRFQLALPLVS